ncbi:MAG: HAMP domain-containing sensor histidine kinase [Thermoanaerobaculia bacterium]
MRLATKFVVAFLAGTVAVLLVYGIFAVDRERTLFENDIRRDTRIVGRAMGVAIADVWTDQGEAKALKLIEDLDDEEPGVGARWVPSRQIPEDLGAPASPVDVIERLSRGEVISLSRQEGVDQAVLTFVPVEHDGQLMGVLEVSESLQPAAEYTSATIVRFGLLAAAISLLAACLAIPIGIRFVGSPLSKLVAKTRRAGQGDFSGDLEIRSKDELGELAAAVNSMCSDLARSQSRIYEESAARMAALEQLRHEDRLKTVGRLASGVAHELGTPLNVIGGRAGLIEQGELDETEITDAARIIKQQANAMTAIVRQLLDFARRRAPEKSLVDLVPVVEQSLELLRPMARKKRVDLALEAQSDPVEADVDARQLQQVVTNLVLNAIQASSSGDEVLVTLEVTGGGLERSICMAVQDRGEGIPPADLPHIFEPFFTTKEPGEGTGLGLSLVYGIVQEHGGKVEVASTPAKGTRFEIRLPSEAGA